MPVANINVDVNEKEIQESIEKKIDEVVNKTLFYWDINKMSQMMSLSKSTLEREFLDDPRLKMLERKKTRGKRIWPVKESLEVIQTILDEQW